MAGRGSRLPHTLTIPKPLFLLLETNCTSIIEDIANIDEPIDEVVFILR
jgi:hypothetical protein